MSPRRRDVCVCVCVCVCVPLGRTPSATRLEKAGAGMHGQTGLMESSSGRHPVTEGCPPSVGRAGWPVTQVSSYIL